MHAETKFIVWDWNGTLLDDADAVLACYNIILSRVGRGPIDIMSFREWHDLPFEIIYRRAGLTEAELERIMAMSEHHAFHDHYEPLAETVALRQGAAEALSHTHRYSIHSFILSNHIVEPIRRQLGRLKIEHYFKDVLAYASRDSQFKDMTKGERLRRFANMHGLDGVNAIVVGDTLEEIEIARSLGSISVAVTGGVVSENRLRAAKPEHLIHSLHELTPILQERGFVS